MAPARIALGVGALFTVVGLTACDGGSLPAAANSVTIDPSDPGRFDKIRESSGGPRFKKLVRTLQEANHRIDWYPPEHAEIRSHDTVQIITFGRNFGFCSGAFISDQLIATAGHCNALNLSEGQGCGGNVVFAYRSGPDAPLTYYECGVLVTSMRAAEEDDSGELKDLAVFQIAALPEGTAPVLRPPFKKAMDWVDSRSGTDMDHSRALNRSLDAGRALLLGVNPPNSAYDMRSQYNSTFGEFESRKTRFQRLHVMMERGETRPGNSGGPLYLVSNETYKQSPGSFATDEGLTWLSPLNGIVAARNGYDVDGEDQERVIKNYSTTMEPWAVLTALRPLLVP